ncbi:uncharacterized protein METZ01_LOCUS278705, partial [marine metagenome]
MKKQLLSILIICLLTQFIWAKKIIIKM